MGGRDAGVTGPRARPPTLYQLLARTLSYALAAHWLVRKRRRSRRSRIRQREATQPKCIRPTALLSGRSSLAACGARVMSWRQPGRRFNKLSVCLHRVSPLLVRQSAADREKLQSGSECDTLEQQQSRASAKRILAGRPCKCGLAIAKLCENAMQILYEYCSAHAGEG